MPILKNLRSWVGGYDMTTDLSEVNMDLSREEQDDTRFQPVGSGGARARLAGLEDVTLSVGGYFASGATAVDKNTFDAWSGGLEEPWTISPDGVEGSPAYTLRGGRFGYTLGDAVGNNHKFTTEVMGTNGETAVTRGFVLKTSGTVSATGATGTGVQVGAVASGSYLYGTLHVLSAGTTITVVLESDNANTFASATTQATFGPITAVGGTTMRVAGPITDDWYRFRITAITGTFTIAAVAAVK